MLGIKVPMRDGVKLNASIYRPKSQKNPLPVVLVMSPYISDWHGHDVAIYLAQHGYVCALVDVRGRGNSEGVFDPFTEASNDGYDTVEWLAKQSWSNGKVAMEGGSYLGFDQWMTLREFPPHLVTIVPTAAVHFGLDFPYLKNIAYPYAMQWLMLTSGHTLQWDLFADSAFWTDKLQELNESQVPFKDYDRIVSGSANAFFQRWLSHPSVDNFWQKFDLSPQQYQKINIPILTVTGYYDGAQTGSLSYYRAHMQYGTGEARAKHFLLIGPWDHFGTSRPHPEIGGLTFGKNSLVDIKKLHVEWYDWTMKGGPRPEFLKQRVTYYVAGSDTWKYAESLDTVSSQRRTLYLNSNGHANEIFHSGGLQEQMPTGAASDEFTFDPRNAQVEVESDAYLTDQKDLLQRGGLVYHTQPFLHEAEISGFVQLSVWMELDVRDTDFAVSLYEILPDGDSVLLTSDQMRARYRESLSVEKLIVPGAINRYDFSGFTFFSRRVSKGSRLRLIITSPDPIAWEKNFNGGGVVAEESGKDANRAHITLFHDAAHPSVLVLPLAEDRPEISHQ